MYFRTPLIATTFALSVAAQSEYATGLENALMSLNLTTLASALSSAPEALLNALQEGNHTVFAPSDEALADPESLELFTRNPVNVLSYHVTAGLVNTDELEDLEVYRTSLSAEPDVLLPGNQSQVILLSKADNGTLLVQNAGHEIASTANATYENLEVFIIDRVLRIPQNFTTVVTSVPELSALVGAVSGVLPDLVDTLARTRGITFFAPINSAVQAISEQLPQLNTSTITNVLLNHLINGTAVYSPQISDGATLTSAGGASTSFVTNSSGVFVTSGPVTARVVEANILTSNGVIHLIDTVLLNTESNPDAATSAAESYSSVQATQTSQQTGAVSSPPGDSSAVALGVGLHHTMYILGSLFFGGLIAAHVL